MCMQRAIIALLVLSSVTPVVGQVDLTQVGCITNDAGLTGEDRYFCEPMNSLFFIQFDQFLSGLEYLETTYPDYVEVKQIGESVNGLPIMFVEITNENSETPREEKIQLGYSASIHANEAAGREGMMRMIEDLAAGIGPNGADLKPLLDVEIVNVWFPNVDSWAAGDYFDADAIAGLHNPADGVGFQRANALGVDLNREFPSPGIIHTDHTPMSEPESQAVVKELRFSGEHSNLVSGVDLHGMIGSPNMIRSIIPNQDYDFRRMVLAVEQLRTTQERVEADPAFSEWNTLASIDDLAEGFVDQSLGVDALGLAAADIEKPMEWGTRWDMIDYTDTGFTSDYLMLSPRSPTGGMGAVGTITEFAYSHMVPDNKFVPKLTDMHVAGVRQIVRTQMEMVGRLDTPVLDGTGPVGYAWIDDVVSSKDDPARYNSPNGKSFDIKDESTWFDFDQVEYEVSNLNFWRDLGRFSNDPITPLDVAQFDVAKLDEYSSFVITNQALDAFTDGQLASIHNWVENGGHLLLTDSALRYFDRVGEGSSNNFNVYLGHSDVQDWDHALMDDVDWAARGLGEGPAVGMQVGNHYPQWTLSSPPSGTEVVGTTNGEASLGRVSVGSGSIDFVGAMLPRPVQEHVACGGQCAGVDHRYGLADYSVSAFAYWVVMNSLGGEIAYEPLESPFIPCYDFDPVYPCNEESTEAVTAESEDTPFVGFFGVSGLLVAVAIAMRRK